MSPRTRDALGANEARAQWDVIVVGTGMGGSALGARLAEAGLSVLFLEKGERVRGTGDPTGGDTPEKRQTAGYWPERIRMELDGVAQDMFLPLGAGVGGSTNLYAAALERFDRTDIEAAPGQPHPTDGWPVPWSKWQHYYAQAERLLRVRGGADAPGSLLPPILASELDRAISARLTANGLSPYPLHVGLSYQPGCGECGGYKCQQRCKSDAETIFIEPALATGNAVLRTGCEVIRISADTTRAHAVVYRCNGREEQASGTTIVLAAGAYHSPALLLRSANAHWPDGLANRSGLVGRNLMLHVNEWVATWAPKGLSTVGPRKTIGFRDHYRAAGMRLGKVQSAGLTASFGNICAFLMQRLATSAWRHLRGIDKFVKLAALIAVRIFGSATVFVMIIEDFGVPENRVMLDPTDSARIRVRYSVDDDLRKRARVARRLLKRSFAGFRTLTLQNEVQLNLGHPCGTCRFGSDPESSVLDPDCRAHGLDNLYVVDGSFMPTSGGANPALTIAANALRVADVLIRRHCPVRETAQA